MSEPTVKLPEQSPMPVIVDPSVVTDPLVHDVDVTAAFAAIGASTLEAKRAMMAAALVRRLKILENIILSRARTVLIE